MFIELGSPLIDIIAFTIIELRSRPRLSRDRTFPPRLTRLIPVYCLFKVYLFTAPAQVCPENWGFDQRARWLHLDLC